MLQEIVDLLFSHTGLDPESRWVSALNYFVYDSIKILLLLFFMIGIIGILRTYLPQKTLKRWMGKSKYGLDHLMAAIFGAITPFCSCSSIPIFLSFMKGGMPLGVSFSFLITSPLVNEYLVVLMFAAFGWKITLAYVLSGIMIGVVAGLILGKMRLEKHLVKDIAGSKAIRESSFRAFRERVSFGLQESVAIVKKLWVWVLVGVGIGALIHNYIPTGFVQSLVDGGGIFSVPLAVLVGIPIYGSCAAIVPIAVALFEKGLPIGTALSFMMAISALSFPEAVILRRAMRLKLIAIFFCVVTVSIIFTGYAFNILQNYLIR
jgi:uncharacterized protein